MLASNTNNREWLTAGDFAFVAKSLMETPTVYLAQLLTEVTGLAEVFRTRADRLLCLKKQP
ncbi:MAG: hypothetical protein PCFJNLEI_02610 [Verrucomicrobiae bacterium]|nr:hypothetical protein [Verrucomicrobiae bacterium]